MGLSHATGELIRATRDSNAPSEPVRVSEPHGRERSRLRQTPNNKPTRASGTGRFDFYGGKRPVCDD